MNVLQNLAVCSVAVVACLVPQLTGAQETANDPIQKHIDSGEFTLAIDHAMQLPSGEADKWLSNIADMQSSSGARYGALQTASMIQDDASHSGALSGFQQEATDPSAGGITEQDFFELINLIQNTVEPTTWELDNVAIQPYPAGVFVDSSGTMKRITKQPDRDWKTLRDSASNDSGNRNVDRASTLRKVSLNRLQRALRQAAAAGETPDDVMKHLAGIYRVKYVFIDETTNEVIIAGPAGSWEAASDGHMVNPESNQPTVLLDDLVVCLRNAWEHDGKLGCSIDPRAKNLKETQKFISTSRLTGQSFRDELNRSLGMQDITVHGVPKNSHAAWVLVEADYLMKLVGLGIQPANSITTYWDQLDLDEAGNPPPMDIARWWFTMNYDSVVVSESSDIFELNGQGVQVMTESEMLNRKGERVHTGIAHESNRNYADDFTKQFDKMSEQYPIYAQLRNVFDMALVSSIIRASDKSAESRLSYFLNDNNQGMHYELTPCAVPREVHSIMNHKFVESRKGGKRLRHMIVGVGGGVEFNAGKVIATSLKRANDNQFTQVAESIDSGGQENWWWD